MKSNRWRVTSAIALGAPLGAGYSIVNEAVRGSPMDGLAFLLGTAISGAILGAAFFAVFAIARNFMMR